MIIWHYNMIWIWLISWRNWRLLAIGHFLIDISFIYPFIIHYNWILYKLCISLMRSLFFNKLFEEWSYKMIAIGMSWIIFFHWVDFEKSLHFFRIIFDHRWVDSISFDIVNARFHFPFQSVLFVSNKKISLFIRFQNDKIIVTIFIMMTTHLFLG